MFIAHRGKVNKDALENSLASFILAIQDDKYSGFECDVRQTLDNKYVICHDAIYKDHIIKYTNLKNLKKLGLTTLDEVLNIDTDKIILLELKDFNMDINNFANIINNSDKNIYIMSFSNTLIKKMKPLIKVKCGVLNYIFNSEHDYNIYDFIALLNNTIDQNIIDFFNSKNIVIFSYGIFNLHQINPNIYYIVDNNDKYMLKY